MHAIFDQRRYLIPFRATLLPQIFTDVLVIGGGVAGMRAALAAAARDGVDVIITNKGEVKDSNTYWAQGGVAAAIASDDNTEHHVQDTLVAGAELCDESTVRRVVEDAPRQIEQLIAWGMPFDRAPGSNGHSGNGESVALGREGGHSHHRILHADGDATGRALALTMLKQVEDHAHIRHFDNCFVLDLITHPDNGSATGERCVGAITHHPKYGLQVIWAGATILASGGVGQVYRESTNPSVATGDGMAMAYRAGAELADLAFVQFHPTTLYVAGASRSLISEAVRGEGGVLIDVKGHRFMPDYDPRADLAPRDIVARAILQQMAKTQHTHVYLDVRHLGAHFAERFPGINQKLLDFGIDPAKELIPVHPSCHYMIGGVRTDADARTTVPGLLAAGEVACTGLHGANRLASNSLLEGLVFGEAAGRTALELLDEHAPSRAPVKVISDIRPSHAAELDLADVRSSLRAIMWRHVGIERDAPHIDLAVESIDFWARYTMDKIFDDKTGWQVQNQLTVGALICRSARWRTESRGTHYRLDFPDTNPHLRVHDIWRRGSTEPTMRPCDGGGG